MHPWHHEHVPEPQGSNVEEPDDVLLLQDEPRPELPGHDPAERAGVAHGAPERSAVAVAGGAPPSGASPKAREEAIGYSRRVAMPELDEAAILTARLELRPLRAEDADEMLGVLDDERLHEFIGGHPLPLDELRHRYETLAAGRSPDGKQLWLNWIVRLRGRGEAVGTVQATVTDRADARHAQIAWVIGVPWQGRGLATEATVALVSWLEQQGIVAICATIHPRHAASQKVATRAGLHRTDDLVAGEEVWRRRELTAAR